MDKNIVQNSEINSTIENDEMYQFKLTENGIYNLYISSTQPYDIDTYGNQSLAYYFDTTGYYSGFASGQTNVGYFKVIRYIGDWNMGCLDQDACNYTDSITLPTSCDYPLDGLNCEGECLVDEDQNGICDCLEDFCIGGIYQGGMIFYVDETGEHGLIAALEDVAEEDYIFSGSNGMWNISGYEWGCYDINLPGANGNGIGSGAQNTMEIISFGCNTESGGINAAEAAAGFQSNGYSDWHLPSKEEMLLMYNNIGNGSEYENIGEFSLVPYWTSTEDDALGSIPINMNYGNFGSPSKHNSYPVRPIRSF